MTSDLSRHSSHEADLTSLDVPAPRGTPGKSTLTSRLPAPVILRVESGERGAARDANGVATGADVAVERAASSSGSPLPGEVREKFESSLGADLSGVRVHTGAESATAATAVGAHAYTVGQDIHFGAGKYDPCSSFGLHLLAHEVAHTVQQQGASPSMQHKLEVSTPGDSAEVEADRAADAMVAGAPATVSGASSQVLRRDPFGFGSQPQPDPFGFGQPTSQPNPFGFPQGPSFGPGAGMPGAIGPFAPNVDANGVPYDIPTVDYRKQAPEQAPPLDAAMPSAQIGDPGSIPGWKTIQPEQIVGQPPFTLKMPAREYVVHGALHSGTAKQAWEAYKNELIPNVRSAWDGDAKAKMDSYTQEAKGNPELDKLIAETKSRYNVAIKPGQGTLSEQGANQQVTPGSTTQQIADKVAQGGDELKQGAAASAAQPEDTTVSGPVKAAVDALNAKREFRVGQMKQLGGLSTELDGAKTSLQGAEEELNEWKGKQAEEEEKKKDPQFELAKKLAGEVHPKLKEVVATIEKYKDPLLKMKAVGENGLKAYSTGDGKAALDAAMGLVDVAQWMILKGKVAELGPAAANPRLTKLSAAHKTAKGVAEQCEGLAKQIEATLKQEKALYDNVAAQLEKHWKGKDPAQGKAAADALRAIPHVDRIVRLLKEAKGAMPKLPSGSTRADQGFALATQGFNAPGAADLLEVAGWIKGAPKSIEPEVTKWEGIRGQLESVAGAVGIV